ncbi:pyruvate kinase [Entophlyctis helioformis]|nr:pyruvate kinase [Entophlyctis helioformis]
MVFPISQASSSGILRTKVSKETLTKLVKSGMNIAIISTLREVLQELPNSPPVGIWLDINGPKVRTGKLANGGPVYLRKGDEFFFVNDQSVLGDHTKVATTYTRELVQVGDKMCVDDGLLSFAVVERLENSIRCIVENNGVLGENKGINFPERTIEDLPTISPKDSQDIQFALKHDVDFISISCIRDIEDMTEVRIRLGNSQIKVLAKIENKRSMINFESILRVADGVVIDRGYLGAEVEVDVISIAQKKMVALANVAGKPIMIANQMLESMCTNPRPTRSEAADVANAVMDGVDGLVLSGETALGKHRSSFPTHLRDRLSSYQPTHLAGEYVVETVETMRKIANQAELNTNYLEFQAKAMRNVAKPVHVNESIASSAVLAARQIGATVIVCITEAGGTARLVAKYRPLIPVLAATTIARTSRQLMANFGLEPYHHKGSPERL